MAVSACLTKITVYYTPEKQVKETVAEIFLDPSADVTEDVLDVEIWGGNYTIEKEYGVDPQKIKLKVGE